MSIIGKLLSSVSSIKNNFLSYIKPANNTDKELQVMTYKQNLKPYITPNKMHGNKKLPGTNSFDFAIICYCPQPKIFDQYKVFDKQWVLNEQGINVENQTRYFIHSHPMHVIFCSCTNSKGKKKDFIVISEVYGVAMSTTTVEELVFYGITDIIGIGFVGAFDNNLKIGDNVCAKSALIEDGLKSTEKYSKPNINFDPELITKNLVTIWCTNTLYQEYHHDVVRAINMKCSVVNMDTSHLYLTAKQLDCFVSYYATVSDVIDIEDNKDNKNNKDTEGDDLDSNDMKEAKEWTNELDSSVNGEDSIVLKNQTRLIQNLLELY
jgi:purine-nucleoside phosphorylase